MMNCIGEAQTLTRRLWERTGVDKRRYALWTNAGFAANTDGCFHVRRCSFNRSFAPAWQRADCFFRTEIFMRPPWSSD